MYHFGLDNNVDHEFFSFDFVLLFFYFKSPYFNSVKNKLKESFYHKRKLYYLIDLLELFATSLLCAHIFACIWI